MAPPQGTAVDEATAFIARKRPILLGDRAVEELQVRTLAPLPTSSHVRYQQTYRGLPVWGARMAVHLDVNGQVRAMQSSIAPKIAIETTPR